MQHEAQHVGPDEDFAQDGGVYEREIRAVEALDQAAEEGVDGGCEEDGGDEDEEKLCDEEAETVCVVAGSGAGSVADCFELRSEVSFLPLCCGLV